MDGKVKWYKKGWFLWVLLIFLPYIGIPFMWITKKDYSTKKKLILSAVFAIWLVLALGMSGTSSDTETNSEANAPVADPVEASSSSDNVEVSNESNTSEVSSVEKEVLPDIPLANDFEKSIWKSVDKIDAKLVSIESIKQDGSEEVSVIAGVLCENNEDVVNSLLEDIKKIIVNNDTNESIIITIGDIAAGEDGPLLLMASIMDDGTIDKSMVSVEYNSERNVWIRDQFSVWDGAHTALEDLIIRNLNDEKSYKHIETTYVDIRTQEQVDTINKALSDSGYSQRAKIGDLFITTQFSAKNAFNATVKNTGYGIASYSDQTITLIAIE